eukprot:CAMPEP_0202511180 /NCGR_PEP_ID=MMETSP1361-20130828/53682_1 /ASSEMBLY_ACC=CAM_ASM_000849 /TAXON_ID=210615 /ORGANISM="Staurosira complex sp., Strain CCMP2646" /LENGTH=375 /DNA_ID=CAMNT_0049145477 /DNA_START=115 /DNA_END=1239 /DNA_ORIENTATION=+
MYTSFGRALLRRPKALALVCARGNIRARGVAAYSATSRSSACHYTIADTPLGQNEAGAALLDGLDVYRVSANDEHPLSVYGIHSEEGIVDSTKKPILLLHGRTWSSVPVYHLLGGNQSKNGQESRSLMEALRDLGLQPYAMDFRGFGGTPPDDSQCVEPLRCVMDAETVLEWICKRHDLNQESHEDMPALLGWSQGALVAQLLAQKTPGALSKLILYGSLYDPLVRHPRAPLYKTDFSATDDTTRRKNLLDEAMEDFTIEGSIPPEPARLFAEAALLADPVKAVWKHLYQFNNCDAARVHVPTLVVAGDQDPYAPLHMQQELFANLGRGSDRTWSILADADHAVHLLDGRARFANIVTSFVQNGKRSEDYHDRLW